LCSSDQLLQGSKKKVRKEAVWVELLEQTGCEEKVPACTKESLYWWKTNRWRSWVDLGLSDLQAVGGRRFRQIWFPHMSF